MAGKKTSNPTVEHKKHAVASVNAAVITLSTSRANALKAAKSAQAPPPEPDKSGDVIQSLLEKRGHAVVSRQLLPDGKPRLRAAVRKLSQDPDVHAIITTGGTGLSPTDVTIEAVRDLLDKELPGFNALFTQLSYTQVKSAAILSRALAGSIGGKVVFCLPGSPRACELAMDEIILPELGHVFHMLWGK
ncbi:MAG: MogA/MoaB family molybdenum cofactor biosynthesis protein [Acidobacteriota bacterium]|jgi:molybdenum cofactor biosynthesis protein B|nr:MogA/MoaB family molybdenum cofactor biosynthesis protein [Acidobacteriota bacterium]